MNIAICDDDPKDLAILLSILKQYDTQGQLTIYGFTTASELYESMKKQSYDIAILDIEMETPNGYEIAVRLSQEGNQSLIIFATNSMDYIIRGYGIAFRYLVKPLTLEGLAPVLDAALTEVNAHRFLFSIDDTSYVLRAEDIYYFEVYNHHTTLHTVDEEYAIRMPLKAVYSQLPLGYFGEPHHSYVVNFMHIKTATAQEVRLTNGVRIPVSRRKQKNFDQQFHRFLGR